MPIDTHAHLSRQGWAGKGSALREGAIIRPLNVSQKKSLSGLGKDRDDAFPFWDHVFTAAAKAITIKIHKDDDDESVVETTSTTALTTIQRTSTGIISNRRPTTGTPAYSGDTTPDAPSDLPTRSLLALAKQQAAKSALYSRFYRGPVLEMKEEEEETASPLPDTPGPSSLSATPQQELAGDDTPKSKKRKGRHGEDAPDDADAPKTKKKRARLALVDPDGAVQEASLPAQTELTSPAVVNERTKKKKRGSQFEVQRGDQVAELGKEEKKMRKESKRLAKSPDDEGAREERRLNKKELRRKDAEETPEAVSGAGPAVEGISAESPERSKRKKKKRKDGPVVDGVAG